MIIRLCLFGSFQCFDACLNVIHRVDDLVLDEVQTLAKSVENPGIFRVHNALPQFADNKPSQECNELIWTEFSGDSSYRLDLASFRVPA